MPLRSFTHQGNDWTVWDTRPDTEAALRRRTGVAQGFNEGWLTFECEQEKRRLAPVPSLWFELTEAQLAALLEDASPVRRAPDMRF